MMLTVPGAAGKQRTVSQEVIDAYSKAQDGPIEMRCGGEVIRIDLLRNPDDLRVMVGCIRDGLGDDSTPEERAVLLRFAARLEVELGNFEQAIRDIEASFETGVLTDEEKEENHFFLGRLYLAVEPPDYARAIENLRTYIDAADQPDPEAFFYLGKALAESDKCLEAIPEAEKAIDLSKTPQENHYRLQLFCHAKLREHDKVVPLAKRMVEKFGAKDDYLKPLAEAQSALGRGHDAFLTQAMRYELGFLKTEAELVGMAELYLTNDSPGRAADVLEMEMKAGRVRRTRKNLNRLGDMWFEAREWEKARRFYMAGSDTRAEIDYKIAKTYFEQQEWTRAERHLRRALNKGGLKEPCKVRLFLGRALYKLKRLAEAEEQFQFAEKSDPCSGEAKEWIAYLDIMREVEFRGTRIGRFFTDLINTLAKSVAAVSDAENIRATAEEALEAARMAQAADSKLVRERKLAEYERARASAMVRLNTGALEEVRKDRAAAETLVAEAARMDLSEDEGALVKRLEETSRRRVKALEAAQADLEKAARIAARAKAMGQ